MLEQAGEDGATADVNEAFGRAWGTVGEIRAGNGSGHVFTAQVHVRMPVILHRDDYEMWLDTGMTKVDALSDLLKP